MNSDDPKITEKIELLYTAIKELIETQKIIGENCSFMIAHLEQRLKALEEKESSHCD